jgi:hypothetical protein
MTHILIPGECRNCRFFNETEDGEYYCAIYNKYWEDLDVEDSDQVEKPSWCLAKSIIVDEGVRQ